MQLTIKEASALIGVHSDTIRRLIKSNAGDTKHITKDKTGYKIDQQWLVNNYSRKKVGAPEAEEPAPSSNSSGLEGAVGEALKVLQEQLTAKDEQIKALNENYKSQLQTMASLLENEQKLRLQLSPVSQAPTESAPEPSGEVIDAVMADVAEPKKKTKTEAKKKQAKNTKPKVKKVAKGTKENLSKPDKNKQGSETKKKRWWQS